MKKHYQKPIITIENIILEEGIASGSALIRPGNENDEVFEEWHQDDNQSKEFDWNF